MRAHLKDIALALGFILVLIVCGYQMFATGNTKDSDRNRNDPEEPYVTRDYFPDDEDAGQLSPPHVRQYSRCDRYRKCRAGGYEVRQGGKRRSIATAGLAGKITDYVDLDGDRLLIAVNGTDIYAYSNAKGGINGSGFEKIVRMEPNERWIAVAPPEQDGKQLHKPAQDPAPKYFIAGTRLIDQRTLTVTGTVPLYRPVYFDGKDLYFLESAAGALRLYAMTLPASQPELVDEMPADCLNEKGAEMLMDDLEISQFGGAQAGPSIWGLGTLPVNLRKAGTGFQQMSQMPRTTRRIMFYSLRGADFFDRHKPHCRDVALTGSPSFEEMQAYNQKVIDARHGPK